MKRMILLATVSIAVCGSVALAQQAPAPQQPAAMHHHHRHDPHHQAVRLGRKLNLAPDQTAKLEPIFADSDQKLRALHEDTALTPQDRHAQMQAIRRSTREQLAAVLTPEQLQQAKAMRHAHHRGDRKPQGT